MFFLLGLAMGRTACTAYTACDAAERDLFCSWSGFVVWDASYIRFGVTFRVTFTREGGIV